MLFCDECGERMFLTSDEIAHHYSEDGWENIDYDADADHVPYTTV